MNDFLKSALVGIAAVLVGLSVLTGIGYAVKYVYRDELRAAQEEKALDKYICDKHRGTIYILKDEEGKTHRVCLTYEGIVR